MSDVSEIVEPTPKPVKTQPARRRALTPVVAEFHPDAVELEERKPPRLARATLYVVLVLITTAIAWASLSSVDEIVTAPGKLITTHPNLVVQPLETSVVRALHVEIGDIVHAGQPLATLDPTFSQSDVEQLHTRLAALDAQIDRLEAELGGGEYAAPAGASEEQLLQGRLFLQRRAFFNASLRNYDAQIARDEANLATNKDQIAPAIGRRDTLREIETMRDTLLEHRTGSRLAMLQARDARFEVESNLSRIRDSQIELSHSIEKTQAERRAFIEEFRRTGLEQLVETRAKQGTAAEELKKAELRRQMVALTAPADSVVLDIAQRNIGSVVREAETLFVLVPLSAPLEAEALVDAKDIGQLATGQAVRIKLDAFPFQKHGTISGLVRMISEDAFTPDSKIEHPTEQTGRHAPPPFYRVRVELTDTALRNVPRTFRMIPGMTISAEMKVGQRKVISYFLYPLMRGLDEGIREP